MPFRPPPGYDATNSLPPSALRVLLAILRAGGRPLTIREVNHATYGDYQNPNRVFSILQRLRSLGLITFEDGAARTIHPTCSLTLYPNAFRGEPQ